MDIVEAHDSFQLHDNKAFDNQINTLARNLDTSIVDVKGALTLKGHLSMFKLDAHCFPIDRFQESWP